MTNRLEAAIAAVSQLSESEQAAIASLILKKLHSMGGLTMPSFQGVMQSIGRDREDDRRQSLG